MNFDGIQIFRIILIVFFVVTMTIFIVIPWFKADKYFVDLSYHDKIKEIEIREGHRGAAHILVDSVWRLLLVDELEMQPYLQPGDSIVKETGERKITVYRRTNDNELLKKEFE